MNSMFSLFDSFCAELLRNTAKSSLAFQPTNNEKDGAQDVLNKKQEGGSSSSSGSVRKQEKIVPRFAPELDGLNCFETLVGPDYD